MSKNKMMMMRLVGGLLLLALASFEAAAAPRTYFMYFNTGTALTQPAVTTNVTCPVAADTAMGTIPGISLLADAQDATCVPPANRDAIWSNANTLSLHYNGAGYASAMNVTGTSVGVRARGIVAGSVLTAKLFYITPTNARVDFTGTPGSVAVTTARADYTISLAGLSATMVPAGSKLGVEFSWVNATGMRLSVNQSMLNNQLIVDEVAATPTVVSINCVGGCTTNAASVSWDVTFGTSVTGVTAGNFSLVNTGLGGTPVITGVSGSGTVWTVTASTGTGTGTLGLDMANTTGVTPALTNLPFTGQVYSVRPPAPVTYYHDTTNGVNIGFDGLTNVTGANQVIPPIITASLNPVSTCPFPRARSKSHPVGPYTHSRWYLNTNYAVATNIGANPSGSASLSGKTNADTVTVSLHDYDPVTGAKVLIGSSPAITLTGGKTQTTYPYTISSSLYTVPAGHRLMLEYAFNQAAANYNARVYCSLNSFIKVTESASPHHIRLEHDGTAISCSAETVTVKACADASCATLYAGAVSGNVIAGGNSVPFSITAGSGQTTVNIHLPSNSALADPQTVRLGTSAVSPVPADAGSPYCNGDVNNTTACDMSVYKAGFLFDVPHLTSGTASGTVNVSAVRSSNNFTCVPLFQNVTRTVAFWGEYQNPVSGTQPLQVNGSNIETTATPAYTSTFALAFNNSGVATLTSVQYDDVGLMQLSARYVGDTANTPPDGGMIVLGSDTFVVKPDHFELSGIQQTAAPNLVNPAAANGAGAKFVKAGEDFTVTVTAKNALGGTTANYGQETAAESVKLTSALVGGLGLTNNPAVAGTFGAFSNGVATGTNFTWSEVGIITLKPSVADADYLGAGDVIGITSGNVGRFYPDHFVLSAGSVGNRNDLSCTPASSFTYMGEPMLLTLDLVAQNVSNGLTQNYAGSFAKLDGATAGKWTTFGSNDSIGLGAVDGTTALSSRLTIDGTPSGSWTTGTGTLSAGVVLNRDVSADGAFNNLKLGIAPQDADGVTLLSGALDLDADLNASSERKLAATGKVRYGRVRLNNAHGSELLALPVPLKVEYYDSAASGFVTNPDDSCTGFAIGDVALGNPTGTMTVLATTPSFVSNPVVAGLSSIKLSKPGSGKYGSVDVTLTVPAWLQYAWGSGPNPTARATFGVYKGNNEFIYQRESY